MSFTWRGVSSDEHGVVVRSLPPVYAPQVRDEAIVVPGRSGALHLQDGALEEQLMMIEGYLPYEQGVEVSDLETIKGWLRGYGDLTLSDRPGRRYRARIVDAIAFSALVAGFQDRIFSVSFWCDPYAYEAEPQRLRWTKPGMTINPSGIETAPVIEVTGSGAVALDVGGVGVLIEGLRGTVTLDCEAKAAQVSEGGACQVTLSDEVWPTLGAGATRIAWTGDAALVVVRPNWRWL